MEIVLLFSISFAAALVVGYAGVATEKAAQEVAKSEIGQKIGRWLFLLPVIDLAIAAMSRLAAGTRGAHYVAADVGRRLPGILSAVVRAAGFLILIGIALWLILWIIALILADYLFEVLILAAVVAGVTYWLRR